LIINRETDYAVRIVRVLHRNGQLSAGEAARLENIPKPIALKMLKRLNDAGVVGSRRGVAGGYYLKWSCRERTLYDLFRAVDGEILLNRCQVEGYRCENVPAGGCGICRELWRVQNILNEELKRTPLCDIFDKS